MLVPKYKSSATLLLTQTEQKSDDEAITQSDVNLNNNLLTTYSEIIKSKTVLRTVIENLELNIEEDELYKEVAVNTKVNSQTLEIVVYNKEAELAQDIANEISEVFSEKVNQLYKINNVEIIDEAFMEEEPYNINHTKDIAISIVLGIVISMMISLLIYFIDTTVKDEKDIEEFVKLPVLINLPLSKNKQKKSTDLISFSDPKSIISESFRTLRTNLIFAQDENLLQNILITSCNPSEGKTYTSSNLAITFAKANKKVIIVDADMRKGRLHNVFGEKNENGLSNYLKYLACGKENDLRKVSQYIKTTRVPNLHIMTSGDRPLNPSELISSPNMLEIIKTLDKIYDVVIIDGTPSAIVSDSIAISKYIKTILVVAEYKRTKLETLKRLKKQIENVNAKITGVILNKYPISEKTYGSGYYADMNVTQRNSLKENNIRIRTVEEFIEEVYEKNEENIREKNTINVVPEEFIVSNRNLNENSSSVATIDEIKNEVLMVKNLFLQYVLSNQENKVLTDGKHNEKIEELKNDIDSLKEVIRSREKEEKSFENELKEEMNNLRKIQEEIKQIQEVNRLKADELIEKYREKMKS